VSNLGANTRVTIYWYAIPNENKARKNWMPVYEENGKQRGSTYGSGYDLNTALVEAKDMAEEIGSRFVGDWDVTVEQKPGTPGAPKTKRKSKAPTRSAPRSPWGEVDTAADTLPWRNSYANWTIRAGEAAAKHNAKIAFGLETHAAWKAGVSPDAYAKARARRA
jgi:hypothetical protein